MGHVIAEPTESEVVLQIEERFGKSFALLFGTLQQMKYQPLSRLGTDPGKTFELIRQVLNRVTLRSHRNPAPGLHTEQPSPQTA
jgi:hypothetical protein